MQEIRKVVVQEAIIKEITKHIIDKGLQQGARLPSERDMSKLLGVSRTSIREALLTLEANKIIKIEHGRGAFVESPDRLVFLEPSNVTDSAGVTMLKHLAQARLMIETYCSLEASKNITPKQIQALYEREEYEHDILYNKNDINNKDAIGMNLERMISSYIENPFINNFHKEIDELWKKLLENLNILPNPPIVRHKAHLEIIKAVQIGSEKRIRKAVERHLLDTIQAANNILHELKKE